MLLMIYVPLAVISRLLTRQGPSVHSCALYSLCALNLVTYIN